MREVKPRVFSLFSGIGGSSMGYKLAGYELLGAVEFLDYQAANYRANFASRLFECDIRALDPLKVAEEIGVKPGELDVLDGSPPCSSFSLSGRREKAWGQSKVYGNKNQRTDDLFFEYVRFLRALKPRAFVAENVPGLTVGVAKGYLKEIARELRASGYRVDARILNAANYGVPQARNRLIFIGMREDLKLEPKFPEPWQKVVTAGEALKGVKSNARELKEASVKNYSIYPMLLKLLPGEQHRKRFNLIKLNPDAPSPTIVAMTANISGASVCHWNNRKFTIPELKRLCSFPDDWKVVGKNYRARGEGFGRAVPPLLMKAVALAVAKTLEQTSSTDAAGPASKGKGR